MQVSFESSEGRNDKLALRELYARSVRTTICGRLACLLLGLSLAVERGSAGGGEDLNSKIDDAPNLHRRLPSVAHELPLVRRSVVCFTFRGHAVRVLRSEKRSTTSKFLREIKLSLVWQNLATPHSKFTEVCGHSYLFYISIVIGCELLCGSS